MDFIGGWPGLIAIVLGLAGIGYGIFARSHPKVGALAYRLVSQPLLAKANADLDVFYDGRSIDEPQLITFELVNLGPDDLSPANLDGGHLQLESAPGLFVAVLEGDGVAVLSERVESEKGSRIVHLAPGILKKGESVTVSVLATGNELVRTRMIGSLEAVAQGKCASSLELPVFSVAAKVNRFRVTSRSRIGRVDFTRRLSRSLKVAAPSALGVLGISLPVKLDDAEWAQRELERVRSQPSSTIEW